MDPKSYYKRTDAILDIPTLASKTVAIIGAGSGGSQLAVDLTRAGTGRILLFDRPGERLEEHNITRHVLGYSALERLKCEALAERLVDLRPDVKVGVRSIDVVAQTELFRDALRETRPDLLLGCTDGHDSQLVVNEAAVEMHLPAVFGGVYDNGVGGEVFTYRPGGACFACFQTRKGRINRPAETVKPFDYVNPNEKERRSGIAINLDILQITLLHARQALSILLGGKNTLWDLPGNVLIFANRAHEGVFPHALEATFMELPPNPKCLVCGQNTLPADWEAQLNAEIAAA